MSVEYSERNGIHFYGPLHTEVTGNFIPSFQCRGTVGEGQNVEIYTRALQVCRSSNAKESSNFVLTSFK